MIKTYPNQKNNSQRYHRKNNQNNNNQNDNQNNVPTKNDTRSLSLISVVMAAGLGKRMSSTKSKVLHEIGEKPMLYYVIYNALSIGSEKILIVVGKYKQEIVSTMAPLFPPHILSKFVYVTQTDAMLDGEVCCLGTGDAIRSCLPYFTSIRCINTTKVIILSGDVPFVPIQQMLTFSKLNNSIMVSSLEDPTGYGRVFMNIDKQLVKIIEQSQCNQDQALCNIVNAGIYNLTVEVLEETIPNIELNQQKKEFFLTDFYLHTTKPIQCFFLPQVPKNVNTLDDLKEINEMYQKIEADQKKLIQQTQPIQQTQQTNQPKPIKKMSMF